MMLDQLRAFLAVAKHLGLRHACDELHLTPTAISKRLKSLQDELGAKLYKPTRQGIELTDAGRVALSKIEIIVKQADELKRAFQPTTRHETPSVMVSVASAFSLTSELLPGVIAGFEKSHAGVRVKFQTGSAQQVEQLLRQGRAEVGVSTHPPFTADLSFEPFRVQTLVFFVSARHPLARRRQLTLSDVLAWPLIIRGMMGGRTWTHDILDQLSQRGYQYKLGLECNERLQVREAVDKNLGVGISYLENLKADVASGRFVVLKGADFRYSMPSYILFSRKRGLSPAGHEFLTWLRQAKKPAQGKRAHEATAKPRKLQLASKS